MSSGRAPALLDRRLIFVLGKGGVGKSSVAIALGMVAAGQGLRTIVAELSSRESVQRAFGHHDEHFVEVELAPGLFTISIDPQHAMEEYLRVKTGRVAPVLSSSRLFSTLTMATPGMRELLSIGKIWELAQLERKTRGGAPYDLVIVDAPATGHGVGILRTPRTFAEIARVGPIAHQGRAIATTIADRSFTAVVAVATPEEMPVNETLELRSALLREGLGLDLAILNAVYPARFAGRDVEVLAERLPRADSRLLRSALRSSLSEHARAGVQAVQRDRLRNGLGMGLIELPYRFCDQLALPELEQLSEALALGLRTLASPTDGSEQGRAPRPAARSGT